MKSNFLNKDISIVLYIFLVFSIIFYLWNTISFKQSQKSNKEAVKQETGFNNTEKYKAQPLTSAITDYKNAVKALKDRDFDLADYDWQNEIFCNPFLNDFKTNKNIQVIKPIIHTNYYNSKRLQLYWKKCPKLKERLNEIVTFEPRTYQDIKDLPYKEQRTYGNMYKSHFGYKLYDIDFDNKKKEHKYIFYSGGFYKVGVRKHSIYDKYSCVDFAECRFLDSELLAKVIDYKTKRATGNYTGVIKYNNKYYLYELETYDEDVDKTTKLIHSIHFDSWNAQKKRFSRDCSFYNIKEE